MLTRLTLMGATLALAGCAAPQDGGSSATTPVTGEDTCNAGSYAGMIGQDAVVALSIPEPKRQYRMGDPVTMDFNPARVNIVLSETDVITEIKCG